MPTNEDLYQEILDEEAGLSSGKLPLSPREIRMMRKEVDSKKASERYQKEIAPVIARARRAERGQSITGNKLKDFWLRVRGLDKLPDVEQVDPNRGIAVHNGVKFEQARQAILKNPDAFRDLRKSPPVVEEGGK